MATFSSTKVKNNFKNAGTFDDFSFHLRNVSVNGQSRGCSGFIEHKGTGKIVYIDTEPYFGGGLFGNKEKSLMYRTAKHLRDYTGGMNQWGKCEDVAKNVLFLTK